MRKHRLLVGVVGVLTALSAPPLRAADQAGQAAGQPQAQAATPKAPARSATLRRTADGHPDIRGTWTKVGGNLNEANPVPTDLKPFVLAEPKGFGQHGLFAGPGGELVEVKPEYEPAPAPPRGIVDPSDRVLPYRPEALAARHDWAKKMCCPAFSLEHLELSARCTPPAPWTGGGRVDILQRPSELVLMFEANHASRVIYTDGRGHQSSAIRTFAGDSVGRWEGNTLVVETTNLTGLGHFNVGGTIAPFSEALRLTERYTVVSNRLITYEMVYDDPKLFTRPIKSAGYFYPVDDGEETVEVTCHEGNYALRNVFGF